MRYAAAAILVLVITAFSPQARARPKLSYFERLAVTNWKLVVRVDKRSSYWIPTAFLLIAARPAQVMATFLDFRRYYQFMPKVKACRVVRRQGKHLIWAVIVLDYPWPVANGWVAVRYRWSSHSHA